MVKIGINELIVGEGALEADVLLNPLPGGNLT